MRSPPWSENGPCANRVQKNAPRKAYIVHHDDDTAVDLELDRALLLFEHRFPAGGRQPPESAALAAREQQRAVRR